MPKAINTAALINAVHDTCAHKQATDTLSRIAVTGGGGALAGLLTGWLLGYRGKRLARNTAFFGVLGAGAGEALNWYTTYLDEHPSPTLESTALAAQEGLRSGLRSTWKATKAVAKGLGKEVGILQTAGDTGAAAILARNRFTRDQLTPGSLEAGAAYRVVGVNRAINKFKDGINSLGDINVTPQSRIKGQTPKKKTVSVWDALVGGSTRQAKRQAMTKIDSWIASLPAAQQEAYRGVQRVVLARAGGKMPQEDYSRLLDMAYHVTGEYSPRDGRRFAAEARNTKSYGELLEKNRAKYPDLVKLMEASTTTSNKPTKQKSRILFTGEDMPSVRSSISSAQAPRRHLSELSWDPRGRVPNAQPGPLSWFTNKFKVKPYVGYDGVQRLGADAGDPRAGAKLVGSVTKRPVRTSGALVIGGRLLNILLGEKPDSDARMQ